MSNNADIDLKLQYSQLARAVKFGFCLILFGVSFFNVLGAIFVVPRFEQIYPLMLGHRALSMLPPITAFVVDYHLALIVLSIALPVSGMMICLFASAKRVVVALTLLMVVAFIQIAITAAALILPLISTNQTMSSSPGH